MSIVLNLHVFRVYLSNRDYSNTHDIHVYLKIHHCICKLLCTNLMSM